MIGGVLFDLGSTLIYATHDQNWGAVMPRMQADLLAHLNAHGYHLAPEAFFSRLSANYALFDQQRQTDWVEYTAGYLISATLADLGAPAPAPDLLAEAVREYFAYSETLYELMPGAHETLRELQAAGLRLGLISNASDNGNVQRLIDRAGLRPYFDPILVSAAVGLRKPNPRLFELALEAWGLPPASVVMVGDTLGADILGAQLAGLRHVWLSARAEAPANQAHRGNIVPEAEIRALAELPPLIRKWSHGL